MPVGDLIAAAIPSIGSLGAAAIQRRWAIKDWERVNNYNLPKNQVKRLRDAGLPLASMFSGSGGSTSSDVRGTEIDPSLGTARGIEHYAMLRMQRKQLRLMDEQIGKAEAEKVIAQVAANEALGKDIFYRGPKYDEKGFLIEGNRQQDSLALDMRQKEATTKTQEIMAKFAEAKSQAEVDHIIEQNKLMFQQHEYRKLMQLMDKWLVNKLSNKGITAIEAMIYSFFIKKGDPVLFK